MTPTLAEEVVAALNIEAGATLYVLERGRWVSRKAGRFAIEIGGTAEQLVVTSHRHLRGFRFRARESTSRLERFDWAAIHRRCSQLEAELSSI